MDTHLIKYLMMLAFLLVSSVYSARVIEKQHGKCTEPSWLGICDQIRQNTVDDADIIIVVSKHQSDWVKFNVTCTNKDLDPVYGYAHFENDKWQEKAFGTAIDDDYCDIMNIPKWIR